MAPKSSTKERVPEKPASVSAKREENETEKEKRKKRQQKARQHTYETETSDQRDARVELDNARKQVDRWTARLQAATSETRKKQCSVALSKALARKESAKEWVARANRTLDPELIENIKAAATTTETGKKMYKDFIDIFQEGTAVGNCMVQIGEQFSNAAQKHVRSMEEMGLCRLQDAATIANGLASAGRRIRALDVSTTNRKNHMASRLDKDTKACGQQTDSPKQSTKTNSSENPQTTKKPNKNNSTKQSNLPKSTKQSKKVKCTKQSKKVKSTKQPKTTATKQPERGNKINSTEKPTKINPTKQDRSAPDAHPLQDNKPIGRARAAHSVATQNFDTDGRVKARKKSPCRVAWQQHHEPAVAVDVANSGPSWQQQQHNLVDTVAADDMSDMKVRDLDCDLILENNESDKENSSPHAVVRVERGQGPYHGSPYPVSAPLGLGGNSDNLSSWQSTTHEPFPNSSVQSPYYHPRVHNNPQAYPQQTRSTFADYQDAQAIASSSCPSATWFVPQQFDFEDNNSDFWDEEYESIEILCAETFSW